MKRYTECFSNTTYNVSVSTDLFVLSVQKCIEVFLNAPNFIKTFLLFVISLLQINLVYLFEDSNNDPTLGIDGFDKEQQKVICASNFLVFAKLREDSRQYAENASDMIPVGDKYIVELSAKNINTWQDYLADFVASKKHRDALKRMRRKLTDNGGSSVMANIKTTEDVAKYFQLLLPLFQETKERNTGCKPDEILFELLKACMDDASHFECHIIFNKEQEPIAFGIFAYFQESNVCAVPGIGNCYSKGNAYLAYHNVLCLAIEFAMRKKTNLDFGMSHYQVKKSFEPTVVKQYLQYKGNSAFLQAVIRMYIICLRKYNAHFDKENKVINANANDD